MPQQVTSYKILIASPSDLVKDRAVIRDVIYAWNDEHCLTGDIVLQPIMWETHGTPEM
jgi:hypothetical protein